MNKKSALIFIFMFFGLMASAAKIKILQTTNKKPVQNSGDAYLANLTFTGFLKCSENSKEPALLKCVKRYFSVETSPAMVLRYSEALTVANEYSELFYCDQKTSKSVEVFQKKNYDFYLCFQSNVVGEKLRTGVIYFKKAAGMPGIQRLQM